MKKELAVSLVVAGLIVATSAALAGAEALGWIAGEVAERLIGVVIGLVLVGYANVAPKRIVASSGGDPARKMAVRRVAGWSLVVAGLGSILVWLFAPFAQAPFLSVAIIVSGLAFALGYCVLTLRRPAV